MSRRDAVRRSRFLVGALAILVALPLASWQVPAQADPPAPLVTATTVDAPALAVVGATIEVTVAVATDPPGQPVSDGEVFLDLATDEADLLFNGYPDALLGPLPLDPDGEAVFEVSMDTDTLPFLTDDPELLYVAAMFNPDDYDAYDYSISATEEIVLSSLIDTATTVTGPATAIRGQVTALTATVEPDDVEGTVRFSVNGNPAGQVDVDGGTASLPYTFASSGTATVRAVFTPEDDAYNESPASDGFSVTVSEPAPPVPTTTATTTVVSAPTTAKVGTPTTLSASVSPAAAAGTVQFSVDGAPIGSPVAVASGAASMSHTFATIGAKTVRATFAPANPSLYAGSASTGAAVTVEGVETTTAVSAPATTTVDTPTTLSASVTPADAKGSVQFSVDGAPVGAPVPVAAGAASISHSFATAGAQLVTASFTPAADTIFAASADSSGKTVAVQIATTTAVAGPASATAGEETSLTATVLPADAAGTVTFSVDGTAVAVVAVDGGAASTPYTFESAGTVAISAQFQPEESDRYAISTDDTQVDVAAGTTATSEDEAVDEDEGTMTGSTCGGTGGRQGKVAQRVVPMPPMFLTNPFAYFGFVPLGPGFQPLSLITPWFTNFFDKFSALNFNVSFFGATLRVGPCGSIIFGPGSKHQPGRQTQSKVTELTVPCTLVETGFQCALPDLPANTEMEISAPFGLPAVVAGRNLGLEGSLVGTDAVTGEQVTLDSLDRIIEVPKRTVLSARLAPAQRTITDASPGERVTYRLMVHNAGVVTADQVRACVTVSKGAEIRVKRADVHGRTACWTLPRLKKGTSVLRKLTVVAPRKGDLVVRASVRPKKSQADPVALTTRLPVT